MKGKLLGFAITLLLFCDEATAGLDAIEGAKQHFSRDVNVTWFIVSGIVAGVGFAVWLAVTAIKRNRNGRGA